MIGKNEWIDIFSFFKPFRISCLPVLSKVGRFFLNLDFAKLNVVKLSENYNA